MTLTKNYKMPSTIKNLYLAKSMEQLEGKTSVNVAKQLTTRVASSAKKLFETAEGDYVDKDEEKAYITYSRFIQLMLDLNGRDDFKKDPTRNQLIKNTNVAFVKLESLKTSLLERYKKLQEPVKEKILEEKLPVVCEDKPIISLNSNPVESYEEDSNGFRSVSCDKLYSLLKDMQLKIILMDARTSQDFEQSHIKHTQCINIPQEILKPGLTAMKLESKLPKASLSRWFEREKADFIVLIDWDSQNTKNSCLQTLEAAMCLWDRCALKKKPFVLQGGYKEWMLKYPMHTTHALDYSLLHSVTTTPIIADISGIEYPNLDENCDKPVHNENKSPDPLFIKSNIPIHATNGFPAPSNKRTSHSAPTVNRNVKPSINRNLKTSGGERKQSNESAQDKRNLDKPTVIRELKPNVSTHLSNNKEEALDPTNELNNLKSLEISDSANDPAEELQENSRDVLKDIENVKPAEINLAKDIPSLQVKNLKAIEKENTEKEKEIERLRELKKKRVPLKRIDPDPPSRTVSSADSALKKKDTERASTEYTIPLAGEGKGLVRSHSSPNIAQMVNQETPLVDRSLKPKTVARDRIWVRDLNPVYGNCPVRPATGIRNLGNTCFMNAIIQCLSNTVPLAEYFCSRQFAGDLNGEGRLAEDLACVIQALWMGQYKSFSPKDFKNTVSRCLSVCIGNEQQDSHEFLVVLMEKLHSDLKRGGEKLPPPKLELLPDDGARADAFWRFHRSHNRSKICDTFEGLLRSTLTCLSCRQTSSNFEVFSCLSLPLLPSRCSLRDCLQLFFKPERIASWDCPRCHHKKEAEKRLHICRLPDIWVLHLKRFSYEGLWRRKLQTHVDFEHAFEMHDRSYSLYGIVNHYGTLEGGHYTAFCKSLSQKWYKYDDHEVTEIADVKTSAAYLLFYTAVDFQCNL